MTGLTQFTELFGAVTVADIVQLCFAVIFLYGVYRKFGKYIIARHESEKKYDEKLNEALDAIHQYPEYRKQSKKSSKLLLTGEFQFLIQRHFQCINIPLCQFQPLHKKSELKFLVLITPG